MVASPKKSPTKKASPKKRARKPAKPRAHPPTSDMVRAAIIALKDRRGSSLQAIKNYIASNYKVDIVRMAPFIRTHIKSAVKSGALRQSKGSGASGRFRLGAIPKKAAKKRKAKKAKKPRKKSAKKARRPKAKKAKKPKAKAAKKSKAARKPKAAKKAAKPKKAARRPKAKKAAKAKK